ncbi:hypothetical protein FA95DRAFT_1675340 [Auriscalpium vulgare]|uniref:Uncharacterized protein n=1 Tax=Auriscalpium vulgare TaxID=40419 RepID=A0ACB8S706_9AGAM|nr:hypothetical protein FA95DRAFT_1675340 [Auriscalpium vulgare]
MAHPFVDPRLLTTLLADAREYHKHLSVLLDTYAQHSLLSLSAYASTSPAPVARAVIAVAGSFAGADDALRRYANSVEAWQTELQAIKGLEEEMSNATRDREILVTRLLEQSRSQRTRKPSTTTLGSSNSGSMADAAQEELRVSDRELTVKKQRLSALRTAALRDGLHRRCEAMIECGQTWADMGKAGMRVLEGIIDVGEDQLEDPLLGVPGTTLAQPEISRVPSHSPTVLKIQSRISTRGSAQPIAQTLPKDSLLLEPLSIPPRMPSTQTLPAPFPITPPSPRRPRSRQQPLIVTKQRSRSRSSSRSRPKSPGNVMLPPPSLDWNTVTRQNASHRPRRHPSPPTILQPRPVSPRQPTLIQPQPQRPTIIYPGTPPSPASPPAHEPIVLPPPTREPNYPRPLSLVDEGPEIDFEQAVRQRRDRWGRTTPVVPAIPGLGSSSTWYQPPYLLPQPMPQIIPPTFIPPTFIPPTFIPPPVTIMTDSDDDDTTVKEAG